MEYYWNLLNNNISNGDGVGGNSCGKPAWDLGGKIHALMLRQEENNGRDCSVTSYSGKGTCCYNPDPHLTCLKLGKRQYLPTSKKGKSICDPASWEKPSAPALPRCQVEGCGAVLANAKDYHRRHRVCEKHAKAPKVVVLGTEQRFCQQCSRFHSVDEFDESKRSCRRRLAGHNERRRRRKSSQEHSLAKRSDQEMKTMAASRNQHHFSSSSEYALSLLSWNSIFASSDLPARCSAALGELIAENRASILACGKNNVLNINNQMENLWIPNGSDIRFLGIPSQQTGDVGSHAGLEF